MPQMLCCNPTHFQISIYKRTKDHCQLYRTLHTCNYKLCYDWTRLWILIWKVGPLSAKAKIVCLLRYGTQLVVTPGI